MKKKKYKGVSMEVLKWAVEQECISKRIDVFLAEELEEMDYTISRSRIQKLAEQQYLKVNDKNVKSNYKLKPKDIIALTIPDAEPVEILPENIDIDILYEDKDVIVVNKPQGMVVHPAAGHMTGTLVNALLYHCRGQLSGINGEQLPGIVHRIDKDTSGVLMVAKTDKAHQSLALQLAEHSITRKYHAIVLNGMKEQQGTVDKPIGRNTQYRKKMAVTEKNSRNAVTHYRVLQKLGNYTYIEAQLETGRTHQIRVHMAYIGHPLLGDTVYGSKRQPFLLQGQTLHAKILGFIHPSTNQYMEFETPLPEYFSKIITKLEMRI